MNDLALLDTMVPAVAPDLSDPFTDNFPSAELPHFEWPPLENDAFTVKAEVMPLTATSAHPHPAAHPQVHPQAQPHAAMSPTASDSRSGGGDASASSAAEIAAMSEAEKQKAKLAQRKLRNKESARRYREKQVARRRQLENFTRTLAEQNRELEALHDRLLALTCERRLRTGQVGAAAAHAHSQQPMLPHVQPHAHAQLPTTAPHAFGVGVGGGVQRPALPLQ